MRAAATTAMYSPAAVEVDPIYTPESIAQRLRRPALPLDPQDPCFRGVPEGTRVVDAAVMVPLVDRPHGVQVLLTQRTAHLADHGGQISFPGGRVEGEDGTREDTALRETEEEIGLDRRHVRILGRLPLYEIPTGFRITPVVAWVTPPFELTLDAFEVEAAFEAPLAHFADPARYQRREYFFRGRHRHYMAIPFEGRYVWGATAAMLYSFARLLAA